MEEVWKPIIIYGITYENYEVSNLGNVRSLNFNNTGKIGLLTPCKNGRGYLIVSLFKNGKSKSFGVHQLVANAFLLNNKQGKVVNHKDENKENNNVNNLEWVTQQENVRYSYRPMSEETKQKISERVNRKKVICIETKQIFDSITKAESWLGKKGVGCCCRGRLKTSGGYHWKYVEEEEKELD